MTVFKINKHLAFYACVLIMLFIAGCAGDNQAAVHSNNNSAQDTVRDSELVSRNTTGNSPGGTPRIVFEKTSYDFGEQVSGVELEKTFTFTNQGDGVLIIENVRAG